MSIDETMQRLSNSVSDSSSSRARLTPSERELSCASASCWIARSRLWIALWLSEVTPMRLPSRISATAIFAPLPGLAGAGWALHEQVALAERQRRTDRIEVEPHVGRPLLEQRHESGIGGGFPSA